VEAVRRVTTAGLGRATIPDATVTAHVQAEGLAYDPIYGWVRENLPDRYMNVDVNGFRHAEALSMQKPEGGWRAFTMGDSQTYGAGVMVGESYPAFAEASLRASRPERRVEVINTGLSGYGSLQALRLIQHKLLDWDPDLLIVDCQANDQPRDGLTPQGQLSGLQRLLFNYRTYYVLRFAIDRATGRSATPIAVHQGVGPNLANGNHDVIMQVAADAGVPVVFLDYPFWNHNNPAARSSEIIACLAPAERLPAGALVIPVCQALKDSGRPPDELFLDNNHLSALGNKIVGEALAEGIRELGLGP
jgi:lysophospholipase L1-like esterase